MSIKIDKSKLDKFKFNRELLGDWIYRLDDLSLKFKRGKPFENIVIDNFFNLDFIKKVEEEFPDNYDNWYKYDNPLEKKYAFDNINKLKPNLQSIFYLLSIPEVVSLFKKISGIDNLEYDDYLHGAGIHAHPKDGKLAIHLDYEKHPLSGKERRLNLILYLNREWKDEWYGGTELWNEEVSKCITKSNIKFNSCLIFKTNDISWHGLPEPINCPDNVFRKTLAYYYVSPLESKKNDEEYRKKATYTLRPQDEKSEYLQRLIKIRSERRLEEEDLE